MAGKYLDQFTNKNDLNEDTNTTTEETSQTGFSMVQYIVSLTLTTENSGCTDIVNKDWVLLDLCSMISCV